MLQSTMCSLEERTPRRDRPPSPAGCLRPVLELRAAPPPGLDGRAGCETWSADFSPGGSWFAWSMGHGAVRLVAWPVQLHGKDVPGRDREDRTLACGQTVWGLAFGPRPARTATSSEDQTALLLDQTGLLLATGLESGVIKIWSVDTGLPLYDLRGHDGIARSLVFPPNGKLTLVSSSRDQTLRIWDLAQRGKRVHVLSGHKDWVSCCCISPDCSMIASVGRFDRMVCLWSLRSYTFIRSLKMGGRHETFYLLASCDFSPDGALLAIAAFTGDGWWIDLWDPYTTECLASMVDYSDIQGKNQISALQFSPSGLHLAIVTEDRALQVWEPGQRRMLLRTQKDRASNGLCCAFHPQGGVVATGTRDGHVRFWKVPQVVPSLSHLCRFAVRHSVPTQQVEALPIPTRILDFLTYRNIPGACCSPEDQEDGDEDGDEWGR